MRSAQKITSLRGVRAGATAESRTWLEALARPATDEPDGAVPGDEVLPDATPDTEVAHHTAPDEEGAS